jgi:hypothetical protein
MEHIDIPDVSGYKLETAEKLLASHGYSRVEAQLTASPRMRQAGYDKNSRVVRLSKSADDTIVLLVCG